MRTPALTAAFQCSLVQQRVDLILGFVWRHVSVAVDETFCLGKFKATSTDLRQLLTRAGQCEGQISGCLTGYMLTAQCKNPILGFT